jgi:tRNA(Ile)-lysidine synthase
LKAKRIAYRADPTNQRTDFLRNKVRLKLLPYLRKEFNPNIDRVLVNLSQNAAIDYAYLKAQSQGLAQRAWIRPNPRSITIDRKPLEATPTAIRRMLIRDLFEKLTHNSQTIDSGHIHEVEQLLKSRPSGSIVHLPRNVFVKKNGSKLVMARRKA